MVEFPNAKINIGLNVLKKRADGFHDLSSFFYPVNICDSLEINVEEGNGVINLFVDGVLQQESQNLVTDAIRRFGKKTLNYRVNLLKRIPAGGGLGGGSSDATFTLKMLQKLNALRSSVNVFQASMELGSDCGFFVENKPSIVSGRGEIIKPLDISLSGWYLVLVLPGIHISTKEAFSGIKPKSDDRFTKLIIKEPVHEWRSFVKNDFEVSVFKQYPQLKAIKAQLYDLGATYSQMSGTGSTVYGLFAKRAKAKMAAEELNGEFIEL